jgi:uncharacterized protein (DUF924 family)
LSNNAEVVAEGAAEVLAFWRRAGEAGLWFRKDAAFDREFAERFRELHMAAARRELDAWTGSADGALALLILLDQYPRNAFRGTGHMVATDPLARSIARAALAAGHVERVDEPLRLFFCLPFAHSEALADQDLSVALYTRLAPEALHHAEGHRDVVRRFGRFPHRNAMLGRETTAEEAAFLASGGFSG